MGNEGEELASRSSKVKGPPQLSEVVQKGEKGPHRQVQLRTTHKGVVPPYTENHQ